jgi:hypothetical protein
MKKLITLVEAIEKVDTSKYSNIKWEGAASSDKINSSLLSEINAAANAADITVTISTANTGHRTNTSSGNVSRHKTGEAVDISKINGSGWSSKQDAQSKNILNQIESFVNKLSYAGYKVNSESGNIKSVLYFGFPEHNNHIHVSSQADKISTDLDNDLDNDELEPEDAGKSFMVDLISGAAKALGLNESKQNRVLKDIQKIKNLL